MRQILLMEQLVCRRWFILVCAALLTGSCLTVGSLAQETGQQNGSKTSATQNANQSETQLTSVKPARPAKRNPSAALKVTPAREAAAMTFARIHHPELSDLLRGLKTHQPSAYEKAVAQLFIASEKLETLRERAPERYELSLNIWKTDSRIRLLAARLMMSADPEQRKELEQLVRQRVALNLQQLQEDRDRFQERLKKLNGHIQELEQNRETIIQRDLDRLLRKVQTENPKNKKPKKPAT